MMKMTKNLSYIVVLSPDHYTVGRGGLGLRILLAYTARLENQVDCPKGLNQLEYCDLFLKQTYMLKC